jgi:hypothetical protein
MNLFKRANLKELSERFLLSCLQDNGSSVEEKIRLLNEVVSACGIKAEFVQYSDNGQLVSGWNGKKQKDLKRAQKLRKELERAWPLGQFEWEAERILDIIEKYKHGKDI